MIVMTYYLKQEQARLRKREITHGDLCREHAAGMTESRRRSRTLNGDCHEDLATAILITLLLAASGAWPSSRKAASVHHRRAHRDFGDAVDTEASASS